MRRSTPGDGTFTYAVLGVDAADTTDLTAACLLMQRPGDREHLRDAHGVDPQRAFGAS